MNSVGRFADDEGLHSTLASVGEDARRVATAYQNKIAAYLLVMARLDGLDLLAARHCLPQEFLHYLQKVLELVDDSNRYFLALMRRRGLSIQCRHGCSHCCRNMPAGVSLAELIYLYHGMHRTGIFARWFRRCLETEECFSALVRGGHPAEASAAPCCGRLDEVLTRFRAHGPGCTFLREDVCQLYAYRPIACRMHYSLSPRYWCDPRHARLSEAVVFNLEPSPAVYEAFELLEQRMGIKLSDVLAVGILELTVNVMQFNKIQWSA